MPKIETAEDQGNTLVTGQEGNGGQTHQILRRSAWKKGGRKNHGNLRGPRVENQGLQKKKGFFTMEGTAFKREDVARPDFHSKKKTWDEQP